MTDLDFLAAALYERYGTVKRARDCFLYTEKGVRLVDSYQEGGRAILGWGGGSAFTQLKNVLSRGLTGSFYTDFGPRLQKAVAELLFSPRQILLYASKEEALAVALHLAPEDTSVWRPWAEGNVVWSERQAVIIEPPLPWAGGLCILALAGSDKDAQLARRIQEETDIVPPLRIPAVLSAAVTRAIYNMIAALQQRSEKDWFLYDTVLRRYWVRKGPYLFPTVEESRYRDFVLHCLEQEVVISPTYEIPSIVPFGADQGVFKKLKRSSF